MPFSAGTGYCPQIDGQSGKSTGCLTGDRVYAGNLRRADLLLGWKSLGRGKASGEG